MALTHLEDAENARQAYEQAIMLEQYVLIKRNAISDVHLTSDRIMDSFMSAAILETNAKHDQMQLHYLCMMMS